MKNTSGDEYEKLKEFLGIFYDWFVKEPEHPPEIHPLVALRDIEGKSRSNAKRGLAMAIGDLVELSSNWPPDQVALADQRFIDNGVPSLSQIRAKYSKRFLRILKRGAIKSLVEYYMVKGVVDGGGIEVGTDEYERLITMLMDYESRLPPRVQT